mgnify:CR=1 FL=1
MAQQPTPPPLEALNDRPFSFYPPILNIEHNEWRFRKATWSEILVVNSMTREEIWIPRRLLGEISRIDEPVVIVGLVKELEYKGGAVWPYQRRVIAMPPAPGALPKPQGPQAVAPAGSAPRTEFASDTRALRLIGLALAVAVVGYLLMANLFREGVLRPRIQYTTRDQSYLELRAHDDYYAVVGKLGQPDRDRWMSETGEIQYRALTYPQRAYTIILMGTDRKSATYVGTLDGNWKPVHAVPFRSGGNTFSMLRELRRF